MNEESVYKISLKGEDEFPIEFEVFKNDSYQSICKDNNYLGQKEEVEREIEVLNQKIAKLDNRIDKFTNHADKLDNSIAIASGFLCGIIDSFFVGTFSFEEGISITNQEMEDKIINLAKKKGWEGIKKGERKDV